MSCTIVTYQRLGSGWRATCSCEFDVVAPSLAGVRELLAGHVPPVPLRSRAVLARSYIDWALGFVSAGDDVLWAHRLRERLREAKEALA